MTEFVHPALLYADKDEYLAGTVPFVRAGLDAGEPVMVAVPGDNLELIRSALGTDADRVVLHDMAVAGRNPGRIIPTVLLAFVAQHAGMPVRIIGEPIWAGRTEMEYPACAQHEALINAALAGLPVTVLCPYDTARLATVWLADAYRTHPVLWTATRRWDSPQYTDPVELAGRFCPPLPDPPGHAARTVVEPGAVAEVRRFAAAYAEAAGLRADRIGALKIAVSELAANTITHTGQPGSIAVWAEDDQLICQVEDTGYISDPLVGRIPVAPDGPSNGRGMLLVNQLCDLVRIASRPGRTTVRVYLRLG